MRGGLVIWQVSERVPLPSRCRRKRRTLPKSFRRPLDDLARGTLFCKNRTWTDSVLAYSPLRSFLSRGFRKLENGVLLPNPSEDLVVVGTLRNGETMLFLDSEMENFYQPKYDSGNYLSEISALVHCSGNTLLVLLVHDKFGVYYPLLRDQRRPLREGESHLGQTRRRLASTGSSRAQSHVSLEVPGRGRLTKEYNYRLDDTHWNRAGIQTAATEILRVWSNHPGSVSNTSVGRNACPRRAITIPA